MQKRIVFFIIIILSLYFFSTCNQKKSGTLPQHQAIIEQFQQSFNEDMENYYPDSALKIAISVIEIKDKIEDYHIIFNAYRQLGVILEIRQEYDSAMVCFENCYKIAEHNKNQKQLASTLHLMSNTLISEEKYDKAKELTYKAIIINKQENQQIHLAGNLTSIGLIHEKHFVYDSALIYYYKADSIYNSVNDISNHAITLANIAGIYSEMGNYEKSLSIFKTVNALNDSINNFYALSSSYNGTGIAFLNSSNYDSALIYFKLSYDLADNLSYEFTKLIAKFNTGRTLSFLGKYESANTILNEVNKFCIENKIIDGQLRCLLRIGKNNLQTKKIKAANDILKKGLALAEKNEYANFEKEFLMELNLLFTLSNSNDVQLKHFERFLHISDSINKINMKNKIAELDIRHETERKDYDIEKLKNKTKLYQTKELYHSIISVLLLVAITLLIFFYRKRNQLLFNKSMLTNEKLRSQEIELENKELESKLKDKEIENQNYKLKQKDQDLVNYAINQAYYSKSFQKLTDKVKHFYLRMKTKKDQTEFIKIIETSRIQYSLEPIQNFENLFTELHPNFMESVKANFPEITNRELQICAMLRLNMTTKAIASATFLSTATVDNARYSIRKKMNLSSEKNLSRELIKY